MEMLMHMGVHNLTQLCTDTLDLCLASSRLM